MCLSSDGLIQPSLGHRQVDEEPLGGFEVLSAPRETPGLEQRLGSAYQRMPIWQLPPCRALPPRPLVGRLREGTGPLGQGSVSRPFERVARTRLREWRSLRRFADRQLRPITALRPRHVEQRADAGHVAGRDAELGCHPEHGLGPDHLVQSFSANRIVAAGSQCCRYLRGGLLFRHDARSVSISRFRPKKSLVLLT